jgi:hypothetical protein
LIPSREALLRIDVARAGSAFQRSCMMVLPHHLLHRDAAVFGFVCYRIAIALWEQIGGKAPLFLIGPSYLLTQVILRPLTI